MCFSVYIHSVYVCVDFYREKLCVGEENVEVNYAFYKREGVHICMCACGGWVDCTLYVCSLSMCGFVCVR